MSSGLFFLLLLCRLWDFISRPGDFLEGEGVTPAPLPPCPLNLPKGTFTPYANFFLKCLGKRELTALERKTVNSPIDLDFSLWITKECT